MMESGRCLRACPFGRSLRSTPHEPPGPEPVPGEHAKDIALFANAPFGGVILVGAKVIDGGFLEYPGPAPSDRDPGHGDL